MDIYNKKMVNRLKRADGQLHAVLRMMAEEQDCINVITQLTAVRSSIDNLIGVIVAENLKNCLLTSNPDNQDAKIDQAIKMIVKK